MATFSKLTPPSRGSAVTRKDGRLVVPDNPIIPFIEGDGTGPDIWRASVRVFDAAVEKAYGGKKKHLRNALCRAFLQLVRRPPRFVAARWQHPVGLPKVQPINTPTNHRSRP